MQSFKRWFAFNRLYFGRPKWDSGITPPELEAFVAEHAPGRALDLGCGTGTNVRFLAQHGWRAIGVDYAPKAILAGRKKLRSARLIAEMQVGDVTRLSPLSPPFDLILDIGCFHSLTHAQMDAYAGQVKRLLAARGAYLLYVHFPLPHRTIGATGADLARFEPQLHVTHRKDGIDTASGGSSAWIQFERPEML